MKPLFIQILKDSTDETLHVSRDEFKKMLNLAYDLGVEDGQNKALAQVCKEQWMPYRYINYPISVPTTTGDDWQWTGVDITSTTGGSK